ncbi:MAG: MASE1 domain-containing protein, partial [Burkholderiaceae bacterium]
MLALADRILSAPRAWQAFAITLVAYVVAARLALLLALPPGIAAPLFPAAGIALVTVLVWGRPALAAVWLGSAASIWWHATATGAPELAGALVVAGIGLGAALQAGVGAALVRRYLGQPLLLAEPPQLWRFFALTGPLACCISASVGLAVMWAAGRIDASQAPAHWSAWWIGDALGVLIFAPLSLTFIGHPRAEWAPRRWPVAVPLLIVTLLMGLGIRQVIQLDVARQRQAFEREADNAANAVLARLTQPLQALEAMRGLVS